jgi:hypothetical protein
MLIVITNIFDSTWLYQDLLDEVSETVWGSLCLICALPLSSPNVIGHANDTILGYRPPFDIPTCLLL